MRELRNDLFVSDNSEALAVLDSGGWEIPNWNWDAKNRNEGDVGVMIISRVAKTGPEPSRVGAVEEFTVDTRPRRHGREMGMLREGIHVCQAGRPKEGVHGVFMIVSDFASNY